MGQPRKWYKLDNCATIVPSSARGADTRVFRITCELKEDVDPALLQKALDRTVDSFPYLLSVLRKGFFWYYLDSRDIRPVVTEDALPACSPLYYEGRKNLLFRVNYYHRRINLEMFHVLSDGTGAFMFFRALVLGYLSLRYGLDLAGLPEEKSSETEKSSDAFRHYYERQTGLKQLKSMAGSKAYHLKGDRDENLLPHLVEGTVSAGLFREQAKQYGVSVGVLAASVYIAAVIDEMSVRDKSRHVVVVSVPVDLRRYFPSETTRNFFGVINVAYPPDHFDGKLESILQEVKGSFDDQLSQEKISQVMNSYEELEHNVAIKMVPLVLKDIATGYLNRMATKGVTSTLSNLGRIDMPEEAVPYIDKFSAFMTAPSEQICIATFQDRMVFGEVSAFTTHEIMLHFFRRLTEMGIPVELATNDYQEL
jgi:hypothetical protein